MRSGSLSIGLGVSFSLAWCAWLALASVRVAITTEAARVEALGVGHVVQATVGGYVASVQVNLGEDVSAGAVLVQLDATAENSALHAKQAERAGALAEIDSIRKELRAIDETLASQEQVAALVRDETGVRLAEAKDAVSFRLEEGQRLKELAASGLVGYSEVLSQAAITARERAQVAVQAIAGERAQASGELARRERVERSLGLRRQIAGLEARRVVLDAEIQASLFRMDQRSVRAPVAGRVGDLAKLTIGSFINPGDALGTIIPPGELRIVAEFSPGDALGRVMPGQDAQMRMTGFPWTRFGMLPARVVRVAEEVRNGTVRVELELGSREQLHFLVRHGLTGILEVQVERASPLELVLRACGKSSDRLVASLPSGTDNAAVVSR